MFRFVQVALFLLFIFLPFIANGKNKKLIMAFSSMICTLIAFRTIGDDTHAYQVIYGYINANNWSDLNIHQYTGGYRVEWIWFYIVYLLKSVGFNEPHLFFFLCGFIPFLVSMKTFTLLNNKNYIVFYFVFWVLSYSLSINVVRAFLSVSLFPLIVYYINQRKCFLPTILILIACSLHSSGFVILAFIFASKLNIRFNGFWAVGSMLFLFILFGVIKQVNIDYVGVGSETVNLAFKYIYKMDLTFYNKHVDELLYVYIVRGLFSYHVILCGLLVCLYKPASTDSSTLKNMHSISCFIICISFAFLCVGAFFMAYRFSIIAIPFIVILVSSLLQSYSFKRAVIMLLSIVVYMAMFLFHEARLYKVFV